jgi:hypothetical protein
MKHTDARRAGMKDGKYNQQVYMPKLNWKDVDYQIRYTNHAQTEAAADGIASSELPKHINFSKVEIVEMEVANGKPFKVLTRQPLDWEYDIVHVILLNELLVKTIWLNKRSDTHKTLKNRSEFVKGE